MGVETSVRASGYTRWQKDAVCIVGAAPTRILMTRLALALILSVALVTTACASGTQSQLVKDGRDLYTSLGCVACHGGRGEGAVGPSLGRIPTVFPACEDQLEWIRLGSQRWLAERGPTYGETDEVVDGVMPSFSELTDLEIRTVAAYERIAFSGLDEAEVRSDCDI